jgi:Erythronolide synthase docking domain
MTASPDEFVEALRNPLKETERLRQENRRLAAASREPIDDPGDRRPSPDRWSFQRPSSACTSRSLTSAISSSIERTREFMPSSFVSTRSSFVST